MSSERLILGIGNRLRGDDAAGLEVIRQLLLHATSSTTSSSTFSTSGWDIRETTGEPTKLMDLWAGYSEVITIDAVVTDQAPAGSIYDWDVSSMPLPLDSGITSSHTLGLSQAIELARILDKIPKKLRVIAIEGANFELTDSLSSNVKNAITKVVKKLSEELGWSHA